MHPAFYRTEPMGAMRVMAVDPGTVIKDERSGDSVTIDDQTFAVKGRVMWCTHTTAERLRASIKAGGGNA